jgi:hypothetical protein
MHSLFAILAAEAATNPAETWYSPGVIGFIATFGVTAAAVGLIFDMVRRVRRVRYRAEIEAKIAAEESQSEGQAKSTASATAASKPRSSNATSAKAAAQKTPTARVKPARPEPPKKPSRD